MVGVGGRSKACATCRKRRVKCDEVKPTCLRCAKAKVVCGGYRGLAVIQYDGGKKQEEPRKINSSSQREKLEMKEYSYGTALAKVDKREEQQSASPAESCTSLEAVICMPVDEIYITYTLANLLRGQEEMEPILKGVDRKLSDRCFLALATIYFGTQHQEKSVCEFGLQRYGGALRELNQVLRAEKRVVSYDLLESVMIMTLFELLTSDNENGWIGHSRGLERLIQLRGPKQFTSLADLIMLQKSRSSIIFAAFALRKSTILSKSEWKTLPWSQHPEQKDELQLLIDIIADCPRILVEMDELGTSMDALERNFGYQTLLQTTMDVLSQLEEWKHSCHQDICSEVPAPDDTPKFLSPEGKSIPLWTTILHYESLYQANVTALYNATLIFLLKQIEELIYSTPGLASLPIAKTFPSRMYTAGIEICRSVDYHLAHIREGAGSFMLLWPLRLAWDAVGRHDYVVGVWLKDVLRKIGEGSAGRWAIARYLLEMKTPAKGVPS